LNEFILILKPPDEWGGSLVNDGRYYNRFNSIKGMNNYLLCPRDPFLNSFSAFLNFENRQIRVTRPAYRQSIVGSDFPNILYFNNAEEIQHRNITINNETIRYCPISKQNINIMKNQTRKNGLEAFGDTMCLWEDYSLLPSQLYIRTNQGGNFTVQANDVNFTINVVQNNNITDGFSEFWVNPIMLQVPVKGKYLGDIVLERYMPLFQNEYVEKNLLLLEPLFDSELNPRLLFYIEGEKQINQRNDSSISTTEYLIWGESATRFRWKPFASLDILKGKFFISNDRGKTKIYWKQPEQLSANECFFISYWKRYWHGEILDKDFDKLNPIPEPSYARVPYYPSRTGGIELDQVNMERACSSSQSIFGCFDKCKTDTFDIIKTILDKPSLENFPINRVFIGHLMMDNEAGRFRLYFNDTNYLSELAEKYIIPQSAVYIEFPECIFNKGNGNQELEESRNTYNETLRSERCLDLINSPYLGARNFLIYLCSNWKNPLIQEKFSSEMKNGWWNKWYESLFNRSHTQYLEFVSETGFILKSSILGEACLGNSSVAYKQSENIRF